MKKQKINLLLILSMIMIFFAGCGESKEKVKEISKKKITFSMSGEPESMDPTTNIYSRGSLVMQNLFRGLYKINSKNDVVPALAESSSYDDATLTYTFKLKPNLKWSDGSPLTARDFEYSWKRALNPEVASKVAFDLYYLKNGEKYNKGEVKAEEVGVKALDDNTLQVILENPTPYFINLLTMTSYAPVKKEVVEGAVPWTKEAKTYVSSGPFMVKEFRPKEKYSLVKNPNYFDANNVKIEELDIIFISSAETEMGGYMTSTIDVAENLSNEAKVKYKDSKELNSSPRIGLLYFDLNTSKAPFNNPKVRKAFSMSFDRQMIIDKILQSKNKPAFAFVPYGIRDGVDQTKDYREVAGDMIKFDVAEAKKLLSEAGYPDGKGFPKIKFITSTNQVNKDTAQAMQSMWKENLGIEAEIVTFESKVYWGELNQGNFDIAYDGWGGSYLDPMTILAIFDTDANKTNNRWSNSEFDNLLKANKATSNQKIRMENFVKAEKIMAEEMPVIPLYYYQPEYLVAPRVTGVYKTVFGHTNFEEADIVATK